MQYLALLFLLPSLAAAALKTICNKTPYGSLELSQCVPLEISFADARDGTLRIFDEEQLAMEEPGRSWPGIRNPFKTSVVQIPRIWTRVHCNLALMSYASPPTPPPPPPSNTNATTSSVDGVSRVGTTSWKDIVEAVNLLNRVCVYERAVGGAVIIESKLLPGRPILTVFIWQPNAYFDTILNDYMTNPHGVHPIDPKVLGGNETLSA